MSRARDIKKVIILNCFGRGGSSILWNMIGSSADVLMPGVEWHQGFYGRHPAAGRVLRKVSRPWGLDVPAIAGLRPLIRRRVISSVPGSEWDSKPDADATVIKLMDHHLAMNSAIKKTFPYYAQVILMRHPVAQCESLIRSGLTLEQAVKWYTDVVQRYTRLLAHDDAHVIKFEEMVHQPFTIRESIYRALDISVPESGAFRIKRKQFGSDRTSNNRAVGDYVDVTEENVLELIDANVNKKSIERVPDDAVAYIWDKAGTLAGNFGYEAGASGTFKAAS